MGELQARSRLTSGNSSFIFLIFEKACFYCFNSDFSEGYTIWSSRVNSLTIGVSSPYSSMAISKSFLKFRTFGERMLFVNFPACISGNFFVSTDIECA